jgi:hypothetical protein
MDHTIDQKALYLVWFCQRIGQPLDIGFLAAGSHSPSSSDRFLRIFFFQRVGLTVQSTRMGGVSSGHQVLTESGLPILFAIKSIYKF